ncbi:lipopolysaccharide core heptose(II) kinase RfaY [Providencia heimbachae]|uniref:RfaY family lipopolysaccharide core biosynthesis protein n=1 Tax=Providencia heimbachae ATCC 35613 TaxID=1354272 RepID=A0A1B7JUT1_9GAMM|nr:lipopolysaccharide core heptose(II) kinase RfaY [Providencia heimbachae]OAT51474.1 RfaY family lipopolysaccharide core biosynthesis protein [Providencia heimbachae ATCC 35613]SQH15927.1 Lipopolysaccharide core heptose(II) kinase rfaY [Providencia heimbachae]
MQKIITTQKNGFNLYQKESSIDYWQVIDDYIHGNIVGKDLGSGNIERSVARINIDGRNFIIKCEKERDKRFEKRIMRMISGPYFSRLLSRLTQAQNQGCTITNDIYFVAEKMKWGESVETWVIAEYVEGTVLSEIEDITPYYAEIKSVVNQLHEYGLSSNDIHVGNFVLTDEGVKVIDLSDYGNLTICKANDLIALKRFYGIEPNNKSFSYRFVMLRDNFRHWSRKIRGKKTRL